jgi:hypothetical protein
MKTISRMTVVLLGLILLAACGLENTTPIQGFDAEPTTEQLPAEESGAAADISIVPERGPRGTTHTFSINAPASAGAEITFRIIHRETGQEQLSLVMRLGDSGEGEVVIETETDDAGGVYDVTVSDGAGTVIVAGFFEVE